MSNRIVSKKQKLLAQKEELLNEIKYYEKRIEEARVGPKNSHYYEDDSSDSEIEFSIRTGPSEYELKLQRAQLETCLNATEELTGLTILQSEANIVLSVPAFEGEAPVGEEGLWREVEAQCRIDLVSFSMTFHTHQPSRQFAPPSYRGLRVLPSKPVHERELSHSVLPSLAVPSDAVEVLRSYAQAHRSRRTTLARLADKYAEALFMETLPEGGYALTCAQVLKASWVLLNKWSAVAPFYHHLVFDFDNMDENYIKTIEQAHKQLSDPTLTTDDRTSLLIEIIDTCLEARSHMPPDSDADSQNSNKPADPETDAPKKSSQIMGPPKSLPKKSKPKGKENTLANERKRRSDTDNASGEETVKKAKANPKIANSKDKSNSNSKNSNKKLGVNENNHSKNSNCEEAAENFFFLNEDPDNSDKVSTKSKDSAKLSTKSVTTLKNTDVIKTKHIDQSKSKTANVKAPEKKISSAKNDNDVPKKELKTKNKIVPAKKQPATLQNKNDEENFDNRPISQKNYPNSNAVATKNLNTNAVIDENEPKTKKTKTLAVEKNKKMPENSKSATQNINSTGKEDHRSQKIMLKNKAGSSKSTQKTDKHIKNVTEENQANIQIQEAKANKEKNHKENLEAKKKNDNLAGTKKQQNLVKNDKQKVISGKNQDLKTNKKVQSKDSLTKSKTNNPTQTLSERFSTKTIIQTHNTQVNTKNLNKNQVTNNNLRENLNSNKNMLNTQNKIVNPLHKTNQKSDKNVPKSNLNDKFKLNNQKLSKSPGAVKKAGGKNSMNTIQSVEYKKSRISQNRVLISKIPMKNPLRISPNESQRVAGYKRRKTDPCGSPCKRPMSSSGRLSVDKEEEKENTSPPSVQLKTAPKITLAVFKNHRTYHVY